jgi:Alpha-galactosidases/6-phospho-beta-glucosidases, family 4 of glycosyl hydrolases
MKVVILGGSAQSTPALFAYLSGMKDLPAIHISLLGRNKSNLAAVARAAKLLDAPISVDYSEIQPPELDAALDGADVVLLQIRVGGYEGRDFDERFPLKYGVCGDEGLGPGGLSAGWRAWPEIRLLLDRVSVAAPNALVVILSSPVGILVRAATQIFPQLKVVGICELPWTTLCDACNSVGVSVGEVTFEYFGVNHLGWFYWISQDERNLVQEFAKVRGESAGFPTGRLIEQWSGVPTKYLRLHFEPESVIEQQRNSSKTRAKILGDLSHTAFKVFARGTADEIKIALSNRQAPWYPHAIGPLLLALMGQSMAVPFFLSVPNNGFYPEQQEDDILEIAHIVEDRQLKRLNPNHSVPARIAQLTSSFVTFERLATTAILSRDGILVRRALEAHPWTGEIKQLPAMVREIIE